MPELLAELFSSRVRAAVLALLLPRPHLSFSLTELSRRLNLPISSLQHECYKLARLGLLHDQRVGNARRYRPNPAFSLLEPMTALILWSLPIEESLRGAAEGVPGLQRAWIAGPLAESTNPIYLVVVGQLDLEAIDALFERVRAAMATAPGPLELAYFLPGDWQARQESGDTFAAALLSDVRIEVAAATADPDTR